jgi:hypothetical protein
MLQQTQVPRVVPRFEAFIDAFPSPAACAAAPRAASSSPKAKKRSQFRVASRDLSSIYETSRLVDICAESRQCVCKEPVPEQD